MSSSTQVPPLTDRENDLLRIDGEFAMENVPGLILEGALWGAYTLFAAYAIYSLCYRGIKDSKPRLALVIVTIVLYLLSTTLFTLDAYAYLVQIKYDNLTIAAPDETAGDKALLTDVLVLRAFFGSWFIFCLQLLIGDAVVIWRTWILWQNQQIFMLIPCFFWLASFATFIAFNVVYCTSDDFPFVALLTNADPGTRPLPGVLQLSNWVLSITTNAISSGMIGYKFWQYRCMLHKLSGASASQSRSQNLKILAILMQSGLVYFVLTGILTMALVTYFNYGSVDLFQNILNKISTQLIGLYPTIVIVLVEFQKQIREREEEESSNDHAHGHFPKYGIGADRDDLSTVQFAPPPTTRDQGRRGVGSESDTTTTATNTAGNYTVGSV